MDIGKQSTQLYENRLMKTDEEIDNFEEAMNSLYKENTLKILLFFVKLLMTIQMNHQ